MGAKGAFLAHSLPISCRFYFRVIFAFKSPISLTGNACRNLEYTILVKILTFEDEIVSYYFISNVKSYYILILKVAVHINRDFNIVGSER